MIDHNVDVFPRSRYSRGKDIILTSVDRECEQGDRWEVGGAAWDGAELRGSTGETVAVEVASSKQLFGASKKFSLIWSPVHGTLSEFPADAASYRSNPRQGYISSADVRFVEEEI